MRPDMSIMEAGEAWLAQVDRADSGLSDATREQYRGHFDRYVRGSQIQGLTLREVNNVATLEHFLQGVADANGSGASKSARTVLSAIITLAVRYGALPHNAVRDTRPAKNSTGKVSGHDTRRAFTREQRDHVLAIADTNERAKRLDVSDLIWFMAGTGVRLSEALSQRWDDVDLEKRTVYVRGTKTESSRRTLHLPDWLHERLTERAERFGQVGVVFHSPNTLDREKPRDKRNVTRVYRAVMDEAGFDWATSHTFRRTVASLIDGQGLPTVLAADQLGHADASMTARVYLGRRGSTEAAAGVL